MIRTLLVLSLVAILTQKAMSAGVDSWHTMQNIGNSYQVFCNDGSKEVLSGFDLLKNNTCPKLDLTRPNGILSLQEKSDKTGFQVICVDRTQKTVTAVELATTEVCNAQLGDFGSGDVVAGLGRSDGLFDLVCTNGKREVVSAFDFRLNNVCPKINLPNPTMSIASVSRKEDGRFDVLCQDRRRETVTAANLLDQSVCKAQPQQVTLKSGLFQSSITSSPFCSTYIVDQVKLVGSSVASLRLVCGSAQSNYWNFTCQGRQCQGYDRSLAILSPTKLTYTRYGASSTLTMP